MKMRQRRAMLNRRFVAPVEETLQYGFPRQPMLPKKKPFTLNRYARWNKANPPDPGY
jgi:hypothetical protein